MSACDTCSRPGNCCHGFSLGPGGNGAFGRTMTKIEVLVELARLGLPFMPTWSGHNWVFDCLNLGADGRCTEYEHRPQLCRDYQPGDDRLCVEYDRVRAYWVPEPVPDFGELKEAA